MESILAWVPAALRSLQLILPSSKQQKCEHRNMQDKHRRMHHRWASVKAYLYPAYYVAVKLELEEKKQ